MVNTAIRATEWESRSSSILFCSFPHIILLLLLWNLLHDHTPFFLMLHVLYDISAVHIPASVQNVVNSQLFFLTTALLRRPQGTAS